MWCGKQRSSQHSRHPSDHPTASTLSALPAPYSKQQSLLSSPASSEPRRDSNSARSVGSASTLSSHSQADQPSPISPLAPPVLALALWEHTAESGAIAASLASLASLALESTLWVWMRAWREEYTTGPISTQQATSERVHSSWVPSASELQALVLRRAFEKMSSP